MAIGMLRQQQFAQTLGGGLEMICRRLIVCEEAKDDLGEAPLRLAHECSMGRYVFGNSLTSR
jgi:hypothetical protein